MRRYWKRMLWGAIAGVCLIAVLLLWRGDRKTIAELPPQLAAETWETDEKPYAMASVFLEASEAIAQERLGEIRLSVEKSLTDGGVGSDNHPWIYGASYQTDETLRVDGASCEVELTAVAGDFFRIHPMVLVSGWYMEEDDLMHDRIVLNRQAAWNLFASDHVEGMLLELGGTYYQVAAVVESEPGELNEMAAGTTPRAWVYADSPGLAGNDQETPADRPAEGDEASDSVGKPVAAPDTPGFTCLEMVLPQPVKGFAVSTMKQSLNGMVSEKTEIMDNSRRFSIENRWKVLKSLGVRGISSDAVEYPYWENAARLAENRLAIRLVPEGLLLCVPIISLLILLLWLNRKRTWGLHSIRDAAENAIDRKRQRDYNTRYGRTSPPVEDWEPEEALPYDEGDEEADEYDAYDEDDGEDDGWDAEAEEAWEEAKPLKYEPSPPKTKRQRRRERRVRRRRAKRRRKAQQRSQ